MPLFMSKIGWLPSLKTSAPGPPRAGPGMVSRTRGTGGTELRCPKVLWAAGHRTLQIFLGWGWRWGLEMHSLGASESFSGNCGPAGGPAFSVSKVETHPVSSCTVLTSRSNRTLPYPPRLSAGSAGMTWMISPARWQKRLPQAAGRGWNLGS